MSTTQRHSGERPDRGERPDQRRRRDATARRRVPAAFRRCRDVRARDVRQTRKRSVVEPPGGVEVPVTVHADVLHLDIFMHRPFPCGQTSQPTRRLQVDHLTALSARRSGPWSCGLHVLEKPQAVARRGRPGHHRPDLTGRQQLDQVGLHLPAHLRRRGVEARTGWEQGRVRVGQDDAYQREVAEAQCASVDDGNLLGFDTAGKPDDQ